MWGWVIKQAENYESFCIAAPGRSGQKRGISTQVPWRGRFLILYFLHLLHSSEFGGKGGQCRLYGCATIF
jgi:hypothetical protein